MATIQQYKTFDVIARQCDECYNVRNKKYYFKSDRSYSFGRMIGFLIEYNIEYEIEYVNAGQHKTTAIISLK
jgi:hypothetical protein